MGEEAISFTITSADLLVHSSNAGIQDESEPPEDHSTEVNGEPLEEPGTVHGTSITSAESIDAGIVVSEPDTESVLVVFKDRVGESLVAFREVLFESFEPGGSYSGRGLRVSEESIAEEEVVTTEYIVDLDGGLVTQHTIRYEPREAGTGMGSATEASVESVESVIVGTPGQRLVTRTVAVAGRPERETIETFELFPWGEELVFREEDAGTGGVGRETTFDYYDDGELEGPDLAAAGRLKSVHSSDGSWRVYAYGRETTGELLQYTYEPWLDLPAEMPGDPLEIDPGTYTGKVTVTEESEPGNPDGDVTTTVRALQSNGGGTGSKVISKTIVSGAAEHPGEGSNLRNLRVTKTHTDGTNFLESHSAEWDESVEELKGRPAYTAGRLERTGGGFGEPVPVAGYRYEDARLNSEYNPGELFVVGGEQGSIVYATSTASYELPMEADKSTVTERLHDPYGRLVIEKLMIMEGTGGPGLDEGLLVLPNPFFEVMTVREWAYDLRGRVTKEWRDGLLLREYSYPSLSETRITGEDGVVRSEFRDVLGRMTREVKYEADGTTPAVTTVYGYTGQGTLDVDTVTTFSGGDAEEAALSSQTVTKRDGIGRVVSQTDAAGLVTSYSYAENQTTVTRPDLSTEITTTYMDGRVKSVAGTGVVKRGYSFSVDADGRIGEHVALGTTEPVTIGYSRADLAGREVESATTGIESPFSVKTTFDYSLNPRDGLLDTSQTDGSPKTYYRYDDYGRLRLVGQDIDGGDELDEGGGDPINVTDRYYWKDGGGVWWQVEDESRYLDENSFVTTLVNRTRERLTLDASAGIVSQTEIQPLPGESEPDSTMTTRVVDRSNRTTTTTSVPDSGLDHVRVEVNGLLVASRTPTVEAWTRYEYDALERTTAVVDPRTGSKSLTHYDGAGRVDYTVDTSGAATVYAYHGQGAAGAGQVASIRNADGKSTSYTYNARGDVATIRGDAAYPVDYAYHADYGWLSTMTTYRGAPGGGGDVTTWVRHPGSGLVTAKLDAESKGVAYTYNDHNQITFREWERVTGGMAKVRATYTYDGAGHVTNIAYNDDTPEVTMEYDRAGRLAYVEDAAGKRDFHYTELGALELEIFDDAGNGLLDGFALDPETDPLLPGRRDGFHIWSGGTVDGLTIDGGTAVDTAVAYGYGGDGRLASVQRAGSPAAHYGYVPSSDLIGSVTFKDGSTTILTRHSAYDGSGRLRTVRATGGSGATVSSHGYAYDALGRRTHAYRHDGSFWTYDYNDRGEVASAVKRLPDGNPLAGRQWGYTYDNIGNRSAHTEGGDDSGANPRAYGYTANALNQYTDIEYEPGSPTAPRAFDIFGTAADPGEVEITVDGGTPVTPPDHEQPPYFHHEVEVGGSNASYHEVEVDEDSNPVSGHHFVPARERAPTYDLDGNMLSDGHWDYTWDAENRLVSVVTAPGLDAAIPKRRVDMAYDYMGRRIARTASHWDSGEDYTDAGERADPANWTADEDWKYLYDGWNVVARLDAADSDSLDQAYVWGPDLSGTMQGAGGVGGLLLVRDADDADDHAPCYDGNGNVVALYLVAGGTPGLTAEYEYDAFGNTLRATGTYAGENGWRFSTKDGDGVTGLVYYGYRYYVPETGRWASRDPIGESGGLNLYGFVRNDGVDLVDRLGLDTYIIVVGIDEDKAAQGLQDKFNKAADNAEEAIRKRPEFSSAKDTIVRLTSGKVSELNDALKNNEKIIELVFFVHGGNQRILLDPKPIEGTDPRDTQITVQGGKTGGASVNSTGVHELSKENLLGDLRIRIYGCRTRYTTGSDDERTATSIADKLVETLNARVLSSDAGVDFTTDGQPFIRKNRLVDGATGFSWRFIKDGVIQSESLTPDSPSILDILRTMDLKHRFK